MAKTPGPYAGSQPPQNPYGAPRNQNPYSQPQQGAPVGYPQQAQNPYGQPQGGANPYAAQPLANPDGVSGGTRAKAKKAGPATWKIYVGVFALFGILAAVFALIPSKDPGSAKAGDCVHIAGDNADSAKKVACSDPSANYTVIQSFDSTSNTAKCQEFADQYPDEVALYQVGKVQYVLCLNPKK